MSSPRDRISIRGARVNNLKGIDVEIPKNALVVITGVSGSGKSTLAFDTIFAEAHRRYVEALSPFARQFVPARARPDVDSISGLSPAIAIERKKGFAAGRSTVATSTEIHDHLRVLFARFGEMHCTRCDATVRASTVEQIVEAAFSHGAGTRVAILAPVPATEEAIARARKEGFVRVRIGNTTHPLEGTVPIGGGPAFVFVDRLTVVPDSRQRVGESVETALRVGRGVVRIEDADSMNGAEWTEAAICVNCGVRMPDCTTRLFSFNAPEGACPACGGNGREPDRDGDAAAAAAAAPLRTCETCCGARLRPEALAVRLSGKTIAEMCALSVDDAIPFFEALDLGAPAMPIAAPLVSAVATRLRFLAEVGLGYLTLDRPSDTLSGGEAERVHLASELGAGLSGLIYVLDEPTVGLHPDDSRALLRTIEGLRDLGNSVLLVEHDLDAVRAADFVIELGPGAGTNGGRVVAFGPREEFLASRESLTASYAAGRRAIPGPSARRVTAHASHPRITLQRVRTHNLQSITASFPIGAWTTVTGVSGSGKSSLVEGTLYPVAAARVRGQNATQLALDRVAGIEHIARVVFVDQRPIGRTPRSNPATYAGLFTPLRELFASLPESRRRGYGPARFSFNVKGGRCESCEGDGSMRVTTYLLPEFFVQCDVCGGARYNRDTLDIRYRGRTIADVLALTVDEAAPLFDAIPALRERLAALAEVGLGYTTLGQPAHTLSSGEAQRLRLATELVRRTTGGTLYLLDEPTAGLHLEDTARLIALLHQLVDLGNTVVVVEHQMDVVKQSDWVIDLGPGGGPAGGRVVFEGTPEDLVCCARSRTAPHLARSLTSA